MFKEAIGAITTSTTPTTIDPSVHPFLSGLYENLIVISIIVVAMIAIASPIVKMIQKTNSENNSTINKNDTESFLYIHLKDQIENHKVELERAREENKRLWDMIRGLESRLSKLEHIERGYEDVKNQLESKNEYITGLLDKLLKIEQENYELKIELSLKEEQLENLQKLLDKCYGLNNRPITVLSKPEM